MPLVSRRERAFLALVLLYSFIPAVFGLVRIPELLGGPPVIPPNPRAVEDPLPIVLHILGSSIFCLLGALQFLPGLRRHRPALHRTLGRTVAAAGGVSALSGVWMTVFSPFPDALQGPLLYWARVTLGISMAGLIARAVVAVRSRNLPAHRAAMLRAYAIGLGASTQTALLLVAMSLLGREPLGLVRDLLMVGAWVINLAAAEILVRRMSTPRALPAAIPGKP